MRASPGSQATGHAGPHPAAPSLAHDAPQAFLPPRPPGDHHETQVVPRAGTQGSCGTAVRSLPAGGSRGTAGQPSVRGYNGSLQDRRRGERLCGRVARVGLSCPAEPAGNDRRRDIDMGQTRFPDSLTEILGDEGKAMVFPCIRDLAVNGLQLSRLSPADPVPNRQDVTQYLAAWCRFAGLDEDACREWLSEYAVAMLSSISRSSASGIRHSTKSNVRYIYRVEAAFVCGREGNRFRACCSDACPVYLEMENKAGKAQGGALTELNDVSPTELSAIPSIPVKQLHRQQFEAAVQLVRRELGKGARKSSILNLLRQQGMQTRTGREWTYAILCTEN